MTFDDVIAFDDVITMTFDDVIVAVSGPFIKILLHNHSINIK